MPLKLRWTLKREIALGESKTLTLAFKRNAVRGTDQRAMEEYQVELINSVRLQDIVQPEISVEAVTDATGNTPLSGNLSPTSEGNNEYEYEIFFKVTANENVPTLNSTSSYSLLSVTGSAAPANVADATLEITPTSGAQRDDTSIYRSSEQCSGRCRLLYGGASW